MSMDARQSRSIKKTSKKQENKAAKDIGGRTQAASGATKFGGADVRSLGKYRVECKFTNKSNYTLKLVELEKLKKQANSSLEYPIFQFCLKSHLGRLEMPFAVIPWNEKDDPYIDLKITAKQVVIDKDLMNGAKSGKLIKLSFLAPPIIRSYRLMLWDDLLEKLKAQEGNA